MYKYEINNNLISYSEAVDKYGMHDKYGREFAADAIELNSVNEKLNIAAFIYSKDGFRFISKIATSINCDLTVNINKYLPKVVSLLLD